jgi:hypothetical protein
MKGEAHVRELLGPAVEPAAGELPLGEPRAELVAVERVEPAEDRERRRHHERCAA